MGVFGDRDVEIQDETDSEPEHFSVEVLTAGTAINIVPATGRIIQLLYVKNANKGPNKNGNQDVLLVTLDGSVNAVSVSRGEYTYFPGTFTSVDIDSNNDNTKAEVIVWS